MNHMIKGIKEDIPMYAIDGYQISDGWFGIWTPQANNNILFYWHACRDSVQGLTRAAINKSGIYFTVTKDKRNNFIAFLLKVEKILGLAKTSRFRSTRYDNILWIKPEHFWLSSKIRRSFFTLMCRCGLHYNADLDNFTSAMEQIEYARASMTAVKRFFRGFTQYTGDEKILSNPRGWRTLFAHKDIKEVRKMLVKP